MNTMLWKRKRRPLQGISFLLLFYLLSMLIPPSTMAMSAYAPKQVSEPTWTVIEHDFGDIAFRDVVFLNASHGWIV
ncbi:MAG: hypothetical protein RTU30_10085, partial [Candidatus Thorarchaeota archaeon]